MNLPEIQNCPGTLAHGYDTYSSTCLRRVFNNHKVSHIFPYTPARESDKDTEKFIANRKRMSISGVQEKLSLVLEKNKLRLTEEKEQGTYIFKPIPADLKKTDQVPANEHLTMQIARQVYGINTAENALIFYENGDPAYITKRFDIKAHGSKYGTEDFASLAGKTNETAGVNYKYTGSYEKIAEYIKKYVSAYRIEIEKFFKVVLFNYLFSNGDAHLKNFSLLESESGDYLLSPAYDLVNTRIHVDDTDFALEDGLFSDKYESGIKKIHGYTAKDDFIEFGTRIGIPEKRFYRLLSPFFERQAMVYTLIDNSYLDDPTKKTYRQYYEKRRNYINR